jgi:type I restriction enzyme S subunit
MKKQNTEAHAETRSSRRESNPPTSAPPREKKSSWQTKTFGEVLEIRNGRNQREVESADGEFPIYGSAGNVMGMATDYICEAGTTIIGRKGNINSPIYADTRFWNVDTAFGLAAKAGMDSRFLYFFCLSYDFSAHNRGTTIPSLVKSELLNIPIPVPPLPEQQRIVGLLDEAFAGIATAKANAEKNLQNARALFESHLQSVFTQRGPGWKATTLGAEIDLLAGFAFKSAQYTNDDDDIRLLRGDNIIQGCLRWDDVKRWPANDTEDYERYRLEEDDVVLAMDRPWVKAGLKHATISADDLPCLLVQRTARLRGGANLDNRFLKLLIGSEVFTSHILGVQTGIGVPHISGQQIKDFEFARPPVIEQRRIADNLESLHEETQRLARIYERKHAALEALKKSLLHQAFTGQL